MSKTPDSGISQVLKTLGAEVGLKIEPFTLIGETVEIVPMTLDHVPGLFEAGSFPGIWDYMPVEVKTLAQMESVVTDALANQKAGTELPFVIFERETGEIVGSSRYLAISVPHRNLEIGWTWLTPTVWRTRVNTECKLLLLKHAFEEMDCVRVQLKTDLRNTRSQEAISRLGAVREGVLRKHMIRSNGYIRDTVMFSIIQEEWSEVRERLEKKFRGD